MTTYIFPGQGSQRKGMGAGLFDEFGKLTAKADAILGYSIKELCMEDPDKLLEQTEYTQPALYVVNALTYFKKIQTESKLPDYLAGHSLGEYNALTAAGAFDFETGLRLVKRRGELMSRAKGGAMAAVLGLTEKDIRKILEQNDLTRIDIANDNAPFQIVISGPDADIRRAAPVFESVRIRSFIRLRVSGAFHSRYMKKVGIRFSTFLNEFKFSELRIPVISNVEAKPYTQENIGHLLGIQITRPVRWTESIRYLIEQGETEFEEIGPGTALTKLVRQIREAAGTYQDAPRTGIEAASFAPQSQESGGKKKKEKEKEKEKEKADEDGARIAIIGMACRFPGANNYSRFWHNLENGIVSIDEIPKNRWDTDLYYSPNIDEPNKTISKWCGLIDNIDGFDNDFFNISPREAGNMDPQQRLLMEETWRCIEDSGISIKALRKKRTAVYVGVMTADYLQEASSPGVVTDSYAAAGNYDAMLANRLSYAFGFHGSSISIDAACASSLVAINSAKRSLIIRESDYALAGGVSLNLHPWKYISFSKSRMLSPDGLCKAFDADADGYVPGEGVGVLLLQRLDDALRAGNHIYAVIRGIAVNHGGRSLSLTAPRVEAQQDVILSACHEAKINLGTVTYVEAHGTGTSLGDPIEIEALTRSFGRYTRDRQFCKIGSVKTNIGHLEAAASVAGVIKVLLMMRHRKIPPTLNIRKINPIIQFEQSPFIVATSLSNWEPREKGQPLRAGVSSFGMGGVNAHAILEEFIEDGQEDDSGYTRVFAISAKTADSLEKMIGTWRDFVAGKRYGRYRLKDICLTMMTGRESFAYRWGCHVKTKEELKAHLLAKDTPCSPQSEKSFCLRIGPLSLENYEQIHSLMLRDTVFKKHLDPVSDALKYLAENSRSFDDLNRLQEIEKGFAKKSWSDQDIPVYSFMIGYASVSALINSGAEPGLVTGEKIGMWVSLVISGMLKIEDVLAVLTGQKKAEQLEPVRPQIPFYDPVSKTILMPFRFHRQYVRFLLNESEMAPGLLDYWVEQARILIKTQFTFKRYMEEWYPTLRQWGKNVEEMLFDDSLLSDRSPGSRRERLQLALIIASSLHRLYLKWDLTEHREIENQAFRELLDLVTDEVMPKTSLAELMNSDTPGFPAIADELGARWHLMNPKNPYKYISTQNRAIIEIKDFSEWVRKAASIDTDPPDVGDMVFAEVGTFTNFYSSDAGVRTEMSANLEETFKDFLIRLWLRGVDLDWGVIFPDGTFQKVALPGYKFDRKSFWLTRIEGYDGPRVVRIDPPGSGLERIHSETPAGKTVQPETKETAGKARPDNMYSQDAGPGNRAEAGDQNRRDEIEIFSEPDSSELIFYRNVWEKSETNISHAVDKALGNVLIFDLGDENRNALKKGLGENVQVVLAKPGKTYRYAGDGIYEINPGEEADYRELLKVLKSRNLTPDKIIHIWSQERFTSDEAALNEQLERGIYSVFYVIREMMQQRLKGRMLLLYVCPADEPQYAAVSGFAKTVRLENPNFVCKTVEIKPTEAGADARQSQIADILLREIQSEDQSDTVIRYAGIQRWVSRLQEFDSQITDRAGKDKQVCLKEKGVYLITGGAGGLGMIFAEYLAKKVKAKLALTGRSGLNAETEAKIEKLKALGSDVLYLKADVSKPWDVEDIVADVKARFKNIDGVIHCAGVIRDAFIIKKTPEDLEAVFAPKIYGTVYLDEALKNEQLDFFVVFSSIVGAVGNMGLSDYAYGNSFLDCFAQMRETWRAAGKRSGKTLSINWPLWQEGGMQISEEEQKVFFKQTGLKPLPTREGIIAWETALESGLSRCIVCYGVRDRIEEALRRSLSQVRYDLKEDIKMAEKVSVDHGRLSEKKIAEKVSVDHSRLSEKTEAFLKQVIAQVIRSSPDKLDSDVNLRDYGIDSIMIHHFNAAMEKYFESLSKTLLFECRTIHEAADYMITYYEPELIALLQPSVGKEAGDLPKPAAVHTGTAETRRKSLKPAVSQDEKPSRTREDEEIAVIGVSGRYPGAKNLDEFWENLKSGKDCITEIPGDRWNLDDYYDPDPEKAAQGKMYCKWGGFLKDADKFDPLFFNISPRDAETMDPQERIFLECAWTAIEDAGYTGRRIREHIQKQNGADVGVFVGVTTNTYLLLGPEEWRKGNMSIPTSFPWSVANRVSYIFDFQGPSMPVDTACSASLTAVHAACQSLRNGECSMALAGGVNLYLHPSKYVWLCQMAMLSPSGKCHSFGINGDGFVPGEGVGAIVLKPLTAAIQNGDNIYAVIKGSSVNHDGITYGYTVPNPNAQANLILQSLKRANINPRTISYFEAHGTGTILGDPIEITGLTKAYREFTGDRQYCPIGSAKSLIGHLEAAAGIAGLTKVLLQMKHRQLAPSLHCEELNPNIAFKDSPFYVQRDLSEWKQPVIVENGKEKTYPRRAGISAFGAGGANAHVIVEEYQQPEREKNTEPQLIVLSAKNKDRLRVYARNLSEFLKANSEYPLSDIAYTLQVGREAMKERVAVIAETESGLCRKLDQYVENPDACRDEDQIFTDDNNALKNSIFKDFTSGGFGKDFVSLIARHRDLHKAALLWVRGTDIPWYKIHEGKDVLSVSLPTYPFERKRYWISSHADIQSRESVLPSFPPPPRERTEVKIHAPHPPHPDPVHGRVQNVLRNMAAALLKMPENDIDFNQNLREYGFDSLAGMKLIHRIEDQYEIKISPAVLFEHNSISALAVYLSEQENMKAVFGEEDHTEEVPAQSELEDVDVDSLSDAEVDELLNRLSKE